MPRNSPIPESQRIIVRNASRKAARNSARDCIVAKQLLGQYLAREIGAAWLNEGQRIGEALIDYWDAHQIDAPTVQWIEGEPR